MPGMIRKNKMCDKIAYKLLHVPKELQQKNEPKLSDYRRRKWAADSIWNR